MESEFEIRDNDSSIVFSGAIPRGLTGYDGCDFDVTLITPFLRASVRVEEVQPQRWFPFLSGSRH